MDRWSTTGDDGHSAEFYCIVLYILVGKVWTAGVPLEMTGIALSFIVLYILVENVWTAGVPLEMTGIALSFIVLYCILQWRMCGQR